MSPAFKRAFSNNLELIFSAAGLLVIWLVPALFAGDANNAWAIAAVTAVLVGTLHGGIFWVVRQRQRQARHQAILEIHEMLEDRVKNQLAVLTMWLPSGEGAEKFAFELEEVRGSVDQIVEMIDALDERSLSAWKGRYREALQNVVGMDVSA